MRDRLLIFAKAPRLGLVKTRLARESGEAMALATYLELLDVLVDRLGSRKDVTVFFTPADGADELRSILPKSWSFAAQTPGDLGARLGDAFEQSFGTGASKVVIIGSDCPYVQTSDIEQAYLALDSNDVVFGPALDGGYWLVGLKALQPDLFADIDWGNSAVLSESLERARCLNLQVSLLRELSDVDTSTDWEEFRRQSSA